MYASRQIYTLLFAVMLFAPAANSPAAVQRVETWVKAVPADLAGGNTVSVQGNLPGGWYDGPTSAWSWPHPGKWYAYSGDGGLDGQAKPGSHSPEHYSLSSYGGNSKPPAPLRTTVSGLDATVTYDVYVVYKSADWVSGKWGVKAGLTGKPKQEFTDRNGLDTGLRIPTNKTPVYQGFLGAIQPTGGKISVDIDVIGAGQESRTLYEGLTYVPTDSGPPVLADTTGSKSEPASASFQPVSPSAHPVGADIAYEKESFDEPYSYYIRPASCVGAKDGCHEITRIYCDNWGRMVFLTGEKPVILQKRIKTLHRGYLPIVECTDRRDGIAYSVQAFGATLSFTADDQTIMFVKLTAENITRSRRKASFWAGTPYNPQTVNPRQSFAMKEGVALSDDQVQYLYDEATVNSKYTTLDVPYEGPRTSGEVLAIPYSTVMNLSRFDWTLKPGEKKSTCLKVPASLFALNNRNAAFAENIKQADYEDYFRRTVKQHDDILARGAKFHVPNAKALDTLKSGLLYLLVSRAKRGEYYEQYDSPVQYAEYWFRSCSVTHTRAYDLFGLADFSRQNIDYVKNTVWFGPREVVKANKIGSRYARKWGINPDPWDRSDLNKYGQKLWTYGEHFLLTGDKQFAAEMSREILGIIKWMDWVTLEDEFNLIPACSLYDNEWVVNAHRPGDDFWSLAGLRAVRRMGERTGNQQLIAQATKVIDRLQPATLQAVDKVMQEAGYVPGSFDRNRVSRVHRPHQVHDGWGEDRDNQLMVWPSGALPADHPAVAATSEKLRSRYEEGVSGFYGDKPGATFQYRGIWLMQQELVRGEQERVVKDLYALLAHTGSTHGGYEVAWKSRWGLETHGWFWSRYIALIRNMIVMEAWDDTLHLFSTVPAGWAKVGNKIGVEDAPTHYGNFSVTQTIRDDGADIGIAAAYRTAPKALVLHLPYFADVSQVSADGRKMRIAGHTVSLPPDTKAVNLTWKTKPNAMAFTYESYLANFWRTLAPVRIPIRHFYSAKERRAQVVRKEWRIAGPFSEIQAAHLDQTLSSEKEIHANGKIRRENGRAIRWQKEAYMPVDFIQGRIIREPYYRRDSPPRERYFGVDFAASLNDIPPGGQEAAYAYTNIYSPLQQEAQLLLGSSGPVKLWLNGSLIHDNNADRSLRPDRDQINVTLTEGWNPLFLKVDNPGDRWAFVLRIAAASDNQVWLSPDSKDRAK